MCVLGSVTPAFADISQYYNFENLSSTYWADSYGFTTGGQQDILNNYENLSFNAGVQGVHLSTGFPTESGVLQIEQTQYFSPITIGLGFAANNVSFWYDTEFGATATAYDANGNLIESISLPKNTTGTGASPGATLPAEAFLTSSSENIASISITDGVGGGFVTVDDLTVSAPDATSTAGLLGLAAAGLLAFRRKVVTQYSTQPLSKKPALSAGFFISPIMLQQSSLFRQVRPPVLRGKARPHFPRA